jgi:hypothetical protein
MDVSPAILIPHYDEDSSTLFLTGMEFIPVLQSRNILLEPEPNFLAGSCSSKLITKNHKLKRNCMSKLKIIFMYTVLYRYIYQYRYLKDRFISNFVFKNKNKKF